MASAFPANDLVARWPRRADPASSSGVATIKIRCHAGGAVSADRATAGHVTDLAAAAPPRY